MKTQISIVVCAVLLFASALEERVSAGTNIQIFYDFGSLNTACYNERSNRITTTIELFYPDKWGSTFAFIDLDYNIHPSDPKNTPFQGYFEIARCLNFWSKTPIKDLSVQVEYNGGLGLYSGPMGAINGYPINHAALVGLNYCLHTKDYKNIFNIELLYKYIVNDYNKLRNSVPLQFTFVWGCDDFCTAPGLRFSGFLDIWGEKLLIPDYPKETITDPDQQSFVLISEPQLWYNVGRWFKCPNLHVGTEIEVSYNFTGSGVMVNPCLGIKWNFD